MAPQALANKIALVTGAAGGIGRATALRFAAEGARIVALDQNQAGLDVTVAAIGSAGGQAFPICADVAVADQVRVALEQAGSVWGRLNVVFNGVGVSGRRWGDGPVDQCTE